MVLDQLAGYPCVRPHGGWSLLIDTRSMGLTPGEASRRLFSRAQVAATPMDGWGPSGSRYLRLVFSSEPAERLTGLRARFDTALKLTPPQHQANPRTAGCYSRPAATQTHALPPFGTLFKRWLGRSRRRITGPSRIRESPSPTV